MASPGVLPYLGTGEAAYSAEVGTDALVREAASGAPEGIVSAAYLLTPHLPVLRQGYRETPMPGRLFHPDYRADFRFGALTLRPGMTAAEITAALRLVAADATATGSG